MSVKTLCVFCGARSGNNPTIAEQTFEIGQTIAKNNITILCGGSDCGLMGALTDGALTQNGRVVGVFPKILYGVEIPHAQLADFIDTPCLPSRKQKMIDLSDAFLILPGGYGTLDEIFEVVVLRRLEANQKPIIFFNYLGFWDYTIKQIERMVEEGFVSATETQLFTVVNSLLELNQLIGKLAKE